MVGTSKILTVSYGTFSCTLEGFDDPFSTMKSISEYFRDLAAEDRYFGAEPPTPDAEMLHRIAEREIQRRVEARVQDNSLVLRQLADDEPQAPKAAQRFEPVAAAAVAAAAAMPEPELEPEEDIAADVAEAAPAPAQEPDQEPEIAQEEPQAFFAEPEFEPEATPQRTEILNGDSIAVKLSRIRAVVSGEDKRAFIEDEHAEEDTFAGRSLASMFDDDEDEAPEVEAPIAEIAEEETDFQADLPDETEDAALEIADEPAEEIVQDDTPEIAAQDEAEVEVEVEDIDQPEDDAADEIDLTVFSAELSADMAETAPQAPEEDASDSDALLSGLIGTLSLDDTARVDAEPTADNDDDFTAHLSDDDTDEDAFESDAAEEDLDAAELAEDDDDTGDIFGLIEDPEAHEILETHGEQEELHQEALAEAIEEDEAEKAAALPQFDLIRKARARVVKMRRADFEAEVQAQSDASDDESAEADGEEDDVAARISDALGQGSLTDDAESDLIRELAAAQQEADAEESHAERARRAERLEASNIEGDDEVNRLMQETDREFSNSEGTRRRSAIQHLKAAVLARRSGPDESDVAEEQVKNRFRDDLERVVKPRRPVAGEGRSEPRRLAPLMLVSEQRVDVATPDVSAAPVRPRRVSSGNLALRHEEEIDLTSETEDTTPDSHENMFSQATSFAEYAEEVGAETLTDLLEAAAAYAVFVEGRESVSRPEIMRAVAEMKAEDGYTREDGLRSFGQLLRDGRIQKLERGRFAVAQDTRFRPEVDAE